MTQTAPTDLRAYCAEQDGELRLHGLTLHRVAKNCGVSPGYLYRVALGHRKATARLACDIEHFTGATVNRRTTLPDFPWDHPVPRLKAAS